MGLEEHNLAIATATEYFGAVPRLIGWGVSGSVFLSPLPDRVVKVHHRQEGYETEREVYRRLDRLRITSMHGLKVPRRYECNDEHRLILMDFVTPPYLLDFAGVLFQPPDFPPDKWQSWHREIEEAYGIENV